MNDPVIVELPLPPSPNHRPSHHMAVARWRNAYKRKAWAAACGQALPKLHPPESVAVGVLFRLAASRDPDNLYASCKYLLDALRKPCTRQEGQWRQGLHEHKGFFLDDSPQHLTLVAVQAVERNAERRGVRVTITPGLTLAEEDL